mgnify:CR=1 FL=1
MERRALFDRRLRDHLLVPPRQTGVFQFPRGALDRGEGGPEPYFRDAVVPDPAGEGAFAQACVGHGFPPDHGADGTRRLESPAEVAAVNGGNGFVGQCARGGLMAALLAEKGFSGAKQILEGAKGMAAGMSQDANVDCLTDRLGERWATIETSFKYHASCRHTHPAADALQQVMREHGLDLTEHLSRRVERGMIEQSTLVLALTSRHRDLLLNECPALGSRIHLLDRDGRDVHDPFGGTVDDYRRCALQIGQNLRLWVSELFKKDTTQT